MIDTVSIIGGGWSVRGLDLARIPGRIIAVNESAVLAPRVDIALTMDRLWCENRWPRLMERSRPTWIRRGANRNCVGTWDGVTVFDCDHTSALFTGEKAGLALNGPHSGFCALNLAYRLAPARVLLFGFDHNRSPEGLAYWHTPYPWAAATGATKPGKYAEWSRQYAAAAEAFAAAGIEVLNASPTSSVRAWRRIDPAKVMM